MSEQLPAPSQAKGIPVKANIKAGGGLNAIVPQTLDETFRYAQMVLQSGMFPDSLKKGKSQQETTAAVTGVILKGMEVGLPPFSALANIMEVNNRFTIWGDGAKGLVLNSGQIESFVERFEGEWGKDDFKAICEIKRIGLDVVRAEFSWADAKLAKLTTKPGPWMQYPKRQLQMRARSWAMRDACADILQGLSIREEVMDIPAQKEEVSTGFLDAGLPAIENHQPAQIEEIEAQRARAAEAGIHVAYAERPVEESSTDQVQDGHGSQQDEQTQPEAKQANLICDTCGGRGLIENADGDKEPCADCNT